MSLVIDASAMGPVLIANEQRDLMEGLIDALSGDGVLAPAHWPLEVANLLLIAFRKNRLDENALASAFATVESVRVEISPFDPRQLGQTVAPLARKHDLTSYDAAYLDLAKRRGCSLATADRALIRAAERESVELFGQ